MMMKAMSTGISEVSLLHIVIRELQRELTQRSTLNPRMCWRLHPDDMLIVMEQAKEYAHELEHPWLPLGDFYLMGIRIFADERAPRLEP
jgi:hypothetical protein